MATDLSPWTGRSNARGLLALAGDWAWIAAVVVLAETLDVVWLYPLWLVLIAHKQFAIGESLLHEASHGTLFATPLWNRRVAPLVAWPFLYTLDGYRKEHMDHHRLLGDPSDPLARQYVHYGLRGPADGPDDPGLSASRALWVWVGRPLLGIPGLLFLWDNIPSLRGERETPWLVLSWAAVVGLCAATGTLDLLVLYWLVPMFYGFGALYYWSEVGDHYAIQQGDTRTILSPLSNWLNHNNGLHALHHRHPGIPWFQLPAAYRALRGTFPEDVSTGWLDTLRQLQQPATPR